MEDQGLVGVDRVAATGANLEVQVGTGAVAGGADGADLLATADGVTGGDADVGLVAVPDLGAVLEGLDGLVAVGTVRAGLSDGAVRDGDDRGARAGRHVQAGVVAGPHAAGHAEAGGEAVAGGGQVPLVLGDLAGSRLGGLAQGLQLGVALGGLLLGGLLELDLGGVLEGLAFGVAADRP